MATIAQEDKIIAKAMSIIEKRLKANEKEYEFNCPDSVKKYLQMYFSNETREKFVCMYLDTKHCLISTELMALGTIDKATIYPREVVAMALRLNASAIILAHNHPSGNSTPSFADDTVTRKIQSLCEQLEIRLLDHFVIGNHPFSYAEKGLL